MLKVINETPTLWVALRGDGDTRAGRIFAQHRPNQRWYLLLLDAEPDAVAPLVDAALQAHQHAYLIEVDDAANETLNTLAARGFTELRREHRYLVPTDWPRSEAVGFDLISAADADVDRWRELDDTLRQDVPGCVGWRNDPARFAPDTFGDPEFDPSTYLLAVDRATGDYAGLVRVWRRRTVSRLGLIGTLPAYRRRGLARALLSQAFDVPHQAGQTEVSCEVDQTNVASNTLLTGLGARRDGGNVELERTVL
ncbi:MAG TPA: GNAT family N-acetyltransferase [Pseudonocardiaceae bacterium]|nr:GNAT family N-acetyltransferase [Pseudonocardiaceae bacterium]